MIGEGVGERDPERVHIFVRPGRDGPIGWGTPSPPAAAPEGSRTANSIGPAPEGENRNVAEVFASALTQEDMGRVLFADPEVRGLIVAHLGAGSSVRLVLDMDDELCAAMWEAALPPPADPDDPDDPWHRVPRDPIGLWENVAVVRRSTTFTKETTSRFEPVFDVDEFEPSGVIVDARETTRASLSSVQLPDEFDFAPPIRFTRAPSAGAEILASDWIKTCRVLHFAGHASARGLRLEGNVRATWDRVSSLALPGSVLRLAVLEACSTAGSEASGDRIPFAWQLAQRVPAVIAMLSEVPDVSANVFFEAFYRELASHPIDFAVARARWALYEWGRGGAHADDWMLPVLFLGTPGRADVPRRVPQRGSASAPSDALALVPAARADAAPLRRILAGGSFQDTRLEADARATPVVIAPDGAVTAALVGRDLLVSRLPGPAQVAHDFADLFPGGAERLTLLAIVTILQSVVRVAVSDADASYVVDRDPDRRWGRPTRVEGGRAAAGVFVREGFLGWNPDSGAFVGPAAGTVPTQLATNLRSVAGLDAAVLGATEVLAAWGKDWDGSPLALVLVRGPARSPWDLAGEPIPGVTQAGIVRSTFTRRPLGGPPSAGIRVAVRRSDGSLSVEHPTPRGRR